jgi:hypothetical protein
VLGEAAVPLDALGAAARSLVGRIVGHARR